MWHNIEIKVTPWSFPPLEAVKSIMFVPHMRLHMYEDTGNVIHIMPPAAC